MFSLATSVLASTPKGDDTMSMMDSLYLRGDYDDIFLSEEEDTFEPMVTGFEDGETEPLPDWAYYEQILGRVSY